MKAVLFDLGHTLIDYYHDWSGPEERIVSRLHRLAMEAGGRMQEPEFRRSVLEILRQNRDRKAQDMVEIPLERVLESIFGSAGCDWDESLVQDGLELFYEALREDRSLVPGTVEMLERVREKGYSIGLISDVAWGLPSEYPLRDIRHFGLDRYFDDMIFSSDVGLRKPNPRMFKMAMLNLGVGRDEAMYVGNSLQADIRGARAVGIRAVLKRSGYFQPDDSIVPDHTVDDWKELDGLL
ncbi:MAG TPA: HAD family hydrolase [Methanomassiliicoccales archaeon]|jgi:putative hydrolase of the HAD superfamily|nr:HAD family hydrolase [Euryarchaeota archaeon]HOE52114.1 HAD family hydrolase [Methanomassiliicoccales archaeon]HOO04457.1 HAD family hydrolase [Methanomassiliicoccales archaeon]HPD08646.1 HAD family hydrolase [Methanomassiliicoccales archaeon]